MPASSQWIRYAVSYSSPAERAAAIAVQQTVAGCGGAALRDDHQQGNEDETYGIKPIVVCAHAGIVAPARHGSISAARPSITNEINEAAEVLPQLRARRLVGELTRGIEDITGPGDLQPAAEPGPGPQGAQHRQPGVLRQDGAETAGRSADDPDRPLAEHLRDVRRRPGQPVDGVLEHAGDRIVVLRGNEQQAVCLFYFLFKSLNGRRDALGGFQVAVVQR